MKNKILLAVTMLFTSVPVIAGTVATNIPEPSVLALFAAAAIAVTIATKIKK
ncbi:PEP-CTERM sorting domain-containing protein [Neptunomonas qingdaonensis]|uniref:PEP-CTERM protein-sorting domain-containing protein n=1 Tax=Neptunomonas qingdaonensis TaxID=1045558 RepID=A0A1I2S4V4_9GAMM|nr:PEP-CTERM sorting domain-containing protein [Neptunomonas qingdaonensis]SFG47955.1 PEP-CTERM protein-sorting domain-containing protein [Neptunomonas qingdaonensis]